MSAVSEHAVLHEAIDLLCDMGLGVDMGTTAPVSEDLRDMLADRYMEREADGMGKGMDHDDWREVIDAELTVYP